MSMHLAIRLDHGTVIANEPAIAHRVAESVLRPALSIFTRLSGRKLDRWSKHAPATVATLETYLRDAQNDSVALDNGRAGKLTATAGIESGPDLNAKSPPASRFMTYFALPFEPDQFEDVLSAMFEVAVAVRVAAGFIAIESSYGHAHRTAVGHSIPNPRAGLSETRIRERRVRDYKNELIDTRLAGLEWGTFLGPGHQVDVDALRRSGAFERVVEVSTSITFLQLTADPGDDLSPSIEDRFVRARAAVSDQLLDTSDLPRLPDA